MQESVENVLHSIEYYQTGQTSLKHELKTLSEELGMELGSFANDMQELSYKVRYPNENENSSLSAQIIDDLEALKEHPDLEAGYQLQNISKMLWAHPKAGISFKKVVEKVQHLLIETERLLREKAVPGLQQAYENSKTKNASSTIS